MSAPAAVLAGLAATLACGAGVLLARRRRPGAPPAGEAARKLEERPVPPVGGPAILVGLLAASAAGATPWAAAGGPAWLARAGETGAWSALAVACAVGLVDDLRRGGLAPPAKLAGQALAGLALTAPGWGAGGMGEALAGTLAAVAAVLFATNVWNTFDNADGAAGGLAALGLAAAGAPAAGAALGFLPWNLAARRPRPGPATRNPGPPGGTARGVGGCAEERGNSAPAAARRAPFAYLGDSGSHLLGVLLLLSPAAWPVFLLPALDLARLVVVRLRAGSAPWVGDRRHLAHRLQARGWPVLGVLAALLAVGGLPLAVPGRGGLALGALAFAALVLASRARTR